MNSASPSSFGPGVEDADETRRWRRRSGDTHFDDTPPATKGRVRGRRRASENVEPGSARAVYLEKNRKAASKCRTKQKVQQDHLVETAREFERLNKQLKAEAEFLKSDVRELMDIVGAHAGCPDKRLYAYVQHEANRLAAIDKDCTVAQLLSSAKFASPEER
jgi:hypothetical protein